MARWMFGAGDEIARAQMLERARVDNVCTASCVLEMLERRVSFHSLWGQHPVLYPPPYHHISLFLCKKTAGFPADLRGWGTKSPPCL